MPPRHRSSYSNGQFPQDRGTRTSSIFPYSTARPPTKYSSQSWLPTASDPPQTQSKPNMKRKNSDPPGINPFDGEAYEDNGETPIYARSDYDGEEHYDGAPTGGTAWSRSSFEGASTAAPTAGFKTALGGIMEDEEDEGSPYSTSTAKQDVSPDPNNVRRSRLESVTKSSRSTLPSVLDLEHLTAKQGSGNIDQGNPFADKPNRRRTFTAQATPVPMPQGYLSSGNNWVQAQGQGDLEVEVMSPSAQNKLGRMSQAPARYSHASPNSETNRTHSPSDARQYKPNSLPSSLSVPVSGIKRMKRQYLAYRLFIQAGLSLIGALLLTISFENGISLSRMVIVKGGIFPVSVAGDAREIALGLGGWCDLSQGGTCRGYSIGDFSNKDGSFTIPGARPLVSLYNLLVALTCLTWLNTAYQLTSAFLHFYLHFALSIPLHHLIDAASSSNPHLDEVNSGGGRKKKVMEEVQLEVDIRVQCEKPPYEGYYWVWWAWWAHRRGPLGGIYIGLVGILSIVTFGMGIGLQRSIIKATGSVSGVSIGVGAMLPLLNLFFVLDSLFSAIRWFLSASESWTTFTNPPSPSPTALMLPPKDKRQALTRRVNSTGSSFYAPQTRIPHPSDPTLPPSPTSSDLNPETKRWLLAYPKDRDLVPLIADLEAGKEHDDFILSDVGLLYLRPDTEDGVALLVPPIGEIRDELIHDAHLTLDKESERLGKGEGGTGGQGIGGVHIGYEQMMKGLSDVFWWMTMEDDVLDFIEECAECQSGS